MYNKKHSNGAINLDKHNNIIVSPYDSLFYDQIEDDVQNAVRILLNKGYLTIASCSGHNLFQCAQVTVVVGNEYTAIELISRLADIDINGYIDYSFEHFNINDINKLFFKSYIRFHCIRITLYNPCIINYPWKQHIINKNTQQLNHLDEYLH